MFKAKVVIKRRPSILDPQGKAVEKGAEHLGLKNIKDTRIGKFIEFTVDTDDKAAAEKEVNEYCIKLLSNPIMEDYEFTLESVSSAMSQDRPASGTKERHISGKAEVK